MSRSKKTAVCAPLPIVPDEGGARVRVGWIAGADGAVPRVDYPGNPGGPVGARSTVPLEPEALLAAVARRQGAVLLLAEGEPRPILIGLLQPETETPLLDAVLGAPAERLVEVAEVDGKRVVVEGRDEIVLRCGEASITLRRNGRVVIRGTQLETRASGLQRIQGGKIEIN